MKSGIFQIPYFRKIKTWFIMYSIFPIFRIASKSNFTKHKTYDETNKTKKNDQKWVITPCFWVKFRGFGVKNRGFQIFWINGIFGTRFFPYSVYSASRHNQIYFLLSDSKFDYEFGTQGLRINSWKANHRYLNHVSTVFYSMFFWSSFFGSFGQLAVLAAQFLAVFGRQVCVGILGRNFLAGQGI